MWLFPGKALRTLVGRRYRACQCLGLSLAAIHTEGFRPCPETENSLSTVVGKLGWAGKKRRVLSNRKNLEVSGLCRLQTGRKQRKFRHHLPS